MDDDLLIAREPVVPTIRRRRKAAPQGYRTCQGPCGRVLPADEFYASGWCKECEPRRVAAYRDAHKDDPAWREERRRTRAAWIERRREHVNAEQRRWQQAKRAAAVAAAAQGRRARGLLTTAEAAEAIGIAQSTIRVQRGNGVLAGVMEGGRIYIPMDAVERYQRERAGKRGPKSTPKNDAP